MNQNFIKNVVFGCMHCAVQRCHETSNILRLTKSQRPVVEEYCKQVYSCASPKNLHILVSLFQIKIRHLKSYSLTTHLF